MKVLVLNGSPRALRSNTLRLTRAFLDGLCAAAPDVQAEELALCRMEIKDCLGCFGCWTKTPGRCLQRDDMNEALEKYAAADVVIFSFPLYYFSLPSRIKAFLDRTLPLALPDMDPNAPCGGHLLRDERLRTKRYVLISTCGFFTPEGNYDAVCAQFSRFLGQGAYTALFCGEGELFRPGQTDPAVSETAERHLALLRQAGAEFALGSVSGETTAAIARPMLPRRVFEASANAGWGAKP